MLRPQPNPYIAADLPSFELKASVTIDGSAYTLSATPLQTPGVAWIICVLTKDSEFEGDLIRNIYTAMSITLGILIISIVTTVGKTDDSLEANEKI